MTSLLECLLSILFYSGILSVTISIPLFFEASPRLHYSLKKYNLIQEYLNPSSSHPLEGEDSEKRTSGTRVLKISKTELSNWVRLKLLIYSKLSQRIDYRQSIESLSLVSATPIPPQQEDHWSNLAENQWSSSIMHNKEHHSEPEEIAKDIQEYIKRERREEWKKLISNAPPAFSRSKALIKITTTWLDYIGRGASFGLILGVVWSKYLNCDILDSISLFTLIFAMLGGFAFAKTFHSRINNHTKTTEKQCDFYYYILAYLVTVVLLVLIIGPISLNMTFCS